METNKNRIAFIVILGVLIVSNVFFGLNYFLLKNTVQNLELKQLKVDTNTKVLHFTSLFIKEVLQSEKEVNFETRLLLENAVRDLKDEEIRGEWERFTSSNTETEAQESVKRLLGILIEKIQN